MRRTQRRSGGSSTLSHRCSRHMRRSPSPSKKLKSFLMKFSTPGIASLACARGPLQNMCSRCGRIWRYLWRGWSRPLLAHWMRPSDPSCLRVRLTRNMGNPACCLWRCWRPSADRAKQNPSKCLPPTSWLEARLSHHMQELCSNCKGWASWLQSVDGLRRCMLQAPAVANCSRLTSSQASC